MRIACEMKIDGMIEDEITVSVFALAISGSL